jgi:hypothetical protein
VAVAVLGVAVAGASLTSASKQGAASASKRTYLLCLNKSGTATVRKYKPGSCAAFGANGAFAGGVDLKRLKWKSWGGKTATGSGVECGFRASCANIAVSVRAYRRKTACGRRVYTRLRATSRFGSSTARLPGCPGRA